MPDLLCVGDDIVPVGVGSDFKSQALLLCQRTERRDDFLQQATRVQQVGPQRCALVLRVRHPRGRSSIGVSAKLLAVIHMSEW